MVDTREDGQSVNGLVSAQVGFAYRVEILQSAQSRVSAE